MLVPLLGTAVVRQQAASLKEPQLRLRQASTRLGALRAAVRSAISAEDLSQRLVALQAPPLAANQQNLSLEQQRLLMNATLDRAAVQIARQQAALPSANPWLLRLSHRGRAVSPGRLPEESRSVLLAGLRPDLWAHSLA